MVKCDFESYFLLTVGETEDSRQILCVKIQLQLSYVIERCISAVQRSINQQTNQQTDQQTRSINHFNLQK